MVLFICLVIIAVLAIPILLVGEDSNNNSKERINAERAVGYDLAKIALMIIEKEDTLWKTQKEKKEILYFLTFMVNCRLNIKFSDNPELSSTIRDSFYIALIMSLKDSFHNLVLTDYVSRLTLYEKCSPSPKKDKLSSSMLILSHFLKIAQGGTREKDVMNILIGKARIEEKDFDQFLGLPETLTFNLIVPRILATIMKCLDELCEKANI